MAASTSGGRGGAALSAPASSQSRAKASWLAARLRGVSASAARRPSSSAAAGQVSPRARNGSSVSPARNCTAACPVSWMQSRWLSPSGVRVNGARLSTRWPAAALWGGRISALPAGGGRGIGQAGSASAAGDQADPQPLAGQGQGFLGLDIPHHAKGRGACPIIKQYLTPQINKMLFYITKLSVIIIPTRACTVKVP